MFPALPRGRTLLTTMVALLAWAALVVPGSARAADPAAQPAVPGQGELLADPNVEANQPRITPKQAIAIADRIPAVEGERKRHPDLRADSVTLFDGSGNWGIKYLAGREELADVTIDGRTGKVVEAWTGVQADWVMARGHKGYFGDKFDAWYIWIPMCLLFMAPFFDPRRPFRMLHLDLLVLIGGFGISHWFFNQGEIGTSVWLVYPVFAYLLARMLYAGLRPRRARQPLVPLAPMALLVAGIVLLGGFRIGLELATGKVGDVGYGSAVGATRVLDGKVLYKDSGVEDQHFDTYGPVNYLAYVPFVKAFPPSQQEIEAPDDYELSSARAATIAFDLFTIIGLFVLGLRLRKGRAGRALGIALAYAWVAFPYTMFPLMSNTNDTLVSALLVWALVALSSPPARGALLGLAAAAKFAPLALVPLFASGRGEGSEHGLAGRIRPWTMFSATFGLVVLLSVLAFVPDDGGFKVFYDQTIGFQFSRESPFSIWGQNPGLDPILSVIKLAVIALGIWVAFKPRTRDAFQVAALGAAVLMGVQFIAVHWFYLYIVWFAPFVLVALFGEYRTGTVQREPQELDRIELPERELEPVGAA